MGGASIFEGIKVTGIALKNGAVQAVNTDQGEIACEYVVNCGGMWAREIGKMVGATVPLHAAEHMHITTTTIEGVYPRMPEVHVGCKTPQDWITVVGRELRR